MTTSKRLTIGPPPQPAGQKPARGPLPLRIARGSRRDLRALARFHYVGKPPAVLQDVVVARYRDPLRGWRVAGVATTSYPTLASRPRSRSLALDPAEQRRNRRFLNRHVRTVSRVIVHPQFRSLGLASRLVAALVRRSRVRYVEAMARMGLVQPIFEHAGFVRTNADHPDEIPHYLLDRAAAGRSQRSVHRRFR